MQNPAPVKPLTSEQLRARHATGSRYAGLVEDEGMRALERALDEAHREEGEAPVESPVDRPTFGSDSVTHKVSWESRLFGKVTITLLDGLGMGNAVKLDRFTMVIPILVNGNPDAVRFEISRELAPGVRLLHAQNGPATDCTEGEIPQFSIPVGWVDGPRGRKVPDTTPRKKNDIDLVFLDTTGNGDGRQGAYLQLEISLSTRNGSFFLAIQQVYAGQVVRTTPAGAEKAGLQMMEVGSHTGSVVPLFAENAYPGSDPFKYFGYLMPDLVQKAVERGASVPLSRCVIARWEPEGKELPTHLAESGWTTATVMWFNAVIGWGFVRCEDGKSCFAHFKQVQNREGHPVWRSPMGFPILTPMKIVAIRFEETPDGKRKATAVRPI